MFRHLQQEWFRFWQTGNENRLLYSLIINEQNLIQEPIISKLFYQKKVFQTVPFYLQELFSFQCSYFSNLLRWNFRGNCKKISQIGSTNRTREKISVDFIWNGEASNIYWFYHSYTGYRFTVWLRKILVKKTEHAYVKTNVSDCKAGTINRDILG